MDAHDRLNVNRVLRRMSKEWRVPVWKVEQIIQENIEKTWAYALSDPEHQKLLDRYFPEGKPTPEQYILLLGHAHERKEHIPFLMKE